MITVNTKLDSVKVERFTANPLFAPETLPPSQPGLVVEGVLNPGAFRYDGKVGLVMRVAERPICRGDEAATLLLDQDTGSIKRWVVSRTDPDFSQNDSRGYWYKGLPYLSTMSHLMVVWSHDGGRSFTLEGAVRILPRGEFEDFGIEDCRVEEIEGTYYLTYTAAGRWGIAAGCMTTRDWRTFSDRQVMLPPPNKDCALFPRRIGDYYYLMHRPSSGEFGGNNIWMARSRDLRNWGDHRGVAATRPGCWDEQRIGAGCAPLETAEGWLEIYHGADNAGRYCLGAILFDLDDPYKVLARSAEPIMEPEAEYELKGFYGNCIFTNGQVVDGDRLRIYYGASDRVIAGADLSIAEILASLK